MEFFFFDGKTHSKCEQQRSLAEVLNKELRTNIHLFLLLMVNIELSTALSSSATASLP